jgi:hypothetical protein
MSKGEYDQDGDGHGDDQMLGIRKEEREKQKVQDKCIIDRAFLVW